MQVEYFQFEYCCAFLNSINIKLTLSGNEFLMHNQQNLCNRVLSKKPDIGFLGCQTSGTIMKLGTVIPYLKNMKEIMNHVTHPLCSANISIFSLEIIKFCYIMKYRYKLHFDA